MNLLLALALSGCTLLQGGTPLMLDGDGFFDHPWPDDRRTTDGHPDLAGFPQAHQLDLVDLYLNEAERLDGFGTSSPLYLRFAREPDLEALPDPAASTATDAPILLVNIDPASPDRGQRTPYTWTWIPDVTDWLPGELLALQPVWGAPLLPKTRYALVLRAGFAAPVEAFTGILKGAHPDAAEYADLAATLRDLELPADEVAYAVQFTTQDTTGEMAAIARATHETLPVAPLDQELQLLVDTQSYTAYWGRTAVPIWGHGAPPFFTEGGQFELDEAGEPILAGWEECMFVVSVPKHAEMPPDGWPVVLTAHGTGGDATTHFYDAGPLQVASVLARDGIAAFGIALPFHGDRSHGGDPSLVSFNYLNPASGRTAFRQGALEQVYLARLLASFPHHLWARATEDTDRADFILDPARVGYLGHSHGGEIGVLATPFFRDTVRGVVLSGAGGGLSISIVERDAGDFDIQGILRGAMGFADGEELTTVHPVIGLVQTVAEVTDPLNYSPYWHDRQPAWESQPQSVLEFEGLQDIYTPPHAIEVLAGAGDQPIFAPVLQVSTIQQLRSDDGAPTPAAGNRLGWDGRPITGGLAQYATDGHFAIFDNPDAAALYQGFLSTALSADIPEVPARP